MSDSDVILYQAGADPHVDDPYGGFLTTMQLRRRDEIVFKAAKKAGVPIAWDLAGGYQTERDGSIPKVLEIHDNTMRECVHIYGSTK
jgi:acetoin utilization deacetylase AcuC-like enzyme